MNSPAAFAILCALVSLGLATAAGAKGVRASVDVGGKEIHYRALPGEIKLTKKDGGLLGHVFYTAYRRDGLKPKQQVRRPIVFLFNGGPGSSSAWLHLGAFGPRRLVLGEGGLSKPEKPYRTTANQFSLIDVADLVFVDPISTGFSRATNLLTERTFFTFRSDVRANANFIKLYLEQEQRQRSPIFIIGESYGAMRACGLAPELEEKHGVVVNGLVLVSGPIVMGRRFRPQHALPTAAAISHYHGLLDEELQSLDRDELLRKVGKFATETYAPALSRRGIDGDTYREIAAKVRAFTGLRRLRGLEFSLREVRVNTTRALDVESIGLYDARVTSERRNGLFRGATGDPALETIREPMEAVMQNYLTGELGYTTDLDYRLMHRIPMWSHYGSKASDTLTRALQTNRGLRVLVTCGYYDTVTPMAVVRQAVEDAEMTPEQRARIRYKNYEGGHMMYTNLPSLEQLSRDVRAFIREAAKRTRGPALVPTSIPAIQQTAGL